jgi:hypothetical protein
MNHKYSDTLVLTVLSMNITFLGGMAPCNLIEV